MTKAQTDLFFKVNNIMSTQYGYIYFETQQLKNFINDWTVKENETPERIADYFQDSLLASGDCEVVE